MVKWPVVTVLALLVVACGARNRLDAIEAKETGPPADAWAPPPARDAHPPSLSPPDADAPSAPIGDAAQVIPPPSDPCDALPSVSGRWTVVPVPVPATETISDVFPVSSTDAWITTSTGKVLRWNGREWRIVTSRSSAWLGSVWVTGDDGWIAAEQVLLRWNGAAWSEHSSFNLDGFGRISTVWGTSPTDVWLGGGAGPNRRILAHWDGKSWIRTDESAGTQVLQIAGTARNGLWAVAHLGQVLRLDGGIWSSVEPPAGSTITGLWVAAPDEVWFAAFGSTGGGQVHWLRQGSWETFVPSGADYYYAVWGSSPSDVWAVGISAAHWDGTLWSSVALPTKASLNRIRSTCRLDLWTVEDSDTALHYGP